MNYLVIGAISGVSLIVIIYLIVKLRSKTNNALLSQMISDEENTIVSNADDKITQILKKKKKGLAKNEILDEINRNISSD